MQQYKNNLQQKVVLASKTQATSSAPTSNKHKLDEENNNTGILPRVVELHKHQQLRNEVMQALDDLVVFYPVRIQWFPTPQLFISSCLIYKTDQSSSKYYKHHVNVIIDRSEINCKGVGSRIIAYPAKDLVEYLKSMLEME